MKVGLAQLNSVVGDLEGNVERCLAAISEARHLGAELVVLPEMILPGCHPRDILLDRSFVTATEMATADLARRVGPGAPVVVGTIAPSERPGSHQPGLANLAAVIVDGVVVATVAKQRLVDADVCFDHRWFVAGEGPRRVDVGHRAVLVVVGNDLADGDTSQAWAACELVVCIAASPFRKHRPSSRRYPNPSGQAPLVWVNQAGANDELVFDGHSFILGSGGAVLAELAGFQEQVQVVDLMSPAQPPSQAPTDFQELFQALVLGIRDFTEKNGIHRVFVGLSGGIDSALVAVLATTALGPQRVTAVAVPSRYSDPRSTSSARQLADELGISFCVVELEPLHTAAEGVLGTLLEDRITAENLQARLRMTVLMSFVNHHKGMLLNTSNKTELSLGYGTLYGDLAGGLSPIGDLTKPEVQALAHWLAEHHTAIPSFILTRPPSAELCPNQVDPFDYATISPHLEMLVQHDRANAALQRSEHKRWQGPVVLKVSERSFGSGRLMPISRR